MLWQLTIVTAAFMLGVIAGFWLSLYRSDVVNGEPLPRTTQGDWEAYKDYHMEGRCSR